MKYMNCSDFFAGLCCVSVEAGQCTSVAFSTLSTVSGRCSVLIPWHYVSLYLLQDYFAVTFNLRLHMIFWALFLVCFGTIATATVSRNNADHSCSTFSLLVMEASRTGVSSTTYSFRTSAKVYSPYVWLKRPYSFNKIILFVW